MTDPIDPTPIDNLPPDPFSLLTGVAIELFTCFTEFVNAGFNEQQALVLVNSALVTNMQINAVAQHLHERGHGEGHG